MHFGINELVCCCLYRSKGFLGPFVAIRDPAKNAEERREAANRQSVIR
jgi:hypothetical protein